MRVLFCATSVCGANDRFLMEGTRWRNSETKGYIGLHYSTRPVPPNNPIPTTSPILRHNLAENHTSFKNKGQTFPTLVLIQWREVTLQFISQLHKSIMSMIL